MYIGHGSCTTCPLPRHIPHFVCTCNRFTCASWLGAGVLVCWDASGRSGAALAVQVPVPRTPGRFDHPAIAFRPTNLLQRPCRLGSLIAASTHLGSCHAAFVVACALALPSAALTQLQEAAMTRGALFTLLAVTAAGEASFPGSICLLLEDP